MRKRRKSEWTGGSRKSSSEISKEVRVEGVFEPASAMMPLKATLQVSPLIFNFVRPCRNDQSTSDSTLRNGDSPSDNSLSAGTLLQIEGPEGS